MVHRTDDYDLGEAYLRSHHHVALCRQRLRAFHIEADWLALRRRSHDTYLHRWRGLRADGHDAGEHSHPPLRPVGRIVPSTSTVGSERVEATTKLMSRAMAWTRRCRDRRGRPRRRRGEPLRVAEAAAHARRRAARGARELRGRDRRRRGRVRAGDGRSRRALPRVAAAAWARPCAAASRRSPRRRRPRSSSSPTAPSSRRRRSTGSSPPGKAAAGDALAASYGGVRGHPVLLARSAWNDVPDEGARDLVAAFVHLDDLGHPGDVDYPEDLRPREA